jgi:hypothetical protein
MELTLGRKEASMPKDWLQKHADVLHSQRVEDDYQRSKDSELRAKTRLVWLSIRDQVSADVERLNSLRGNQDVQYTPAVDAFVLNRANFPTITVRVRFPDPHLVSYETTSNYAPDASQREAHGHFAFKLDHAGNVRIFHHGEMLEDEGSVSEVLLTPFLSA